MVLFVLSFVQCPALCDALHGSIQDKENSPMMRAGEARSSDEVLSFHGRTSCPHGFSRLCAVLCAQVCKLYRFQTDDRRWLLVKEQMSETPLSFSVPKQLLSALVQELTSRLVGVEELGKA